MQFYSDADGTVVSLLTEAVLFTTAELVLSFVLWVLAALSAC